MTPVIGRFDIFKKSRRVLPAGAGKNCRKNRASRRYDTGDRNLSGLPPFARLFSCFSASFS